VSVQFISRPSRTVSRKAPSLYSRLSECQKKKQTPFPCCRCFCSCRGRRGFPCDGRLTVGSVPCRRGESGSIQIGSSRFGVVTGQVFSRIAEQQTVEG